MIVAKTKNDLLYALSKVKNKGVTLVPTLGGLHNAHLSLFNLAKDSLINKDKSTLVASIFLNPLQFNSKDDYVNYPASTEEDIELAKKNHVDILFLPAIEEIYKQEEQNVHSSISTNQTTIKAPLLSQCLCGQNRPGHFDGVLTIVNILFNIVRPDQAIFGEKDFQQLRLIENMVEDLHQDIKIIRAPLIREESGLALSSRNRKLSNRGISEAASIYKTLSYLKELYSNLDCPEKLPDLLNKAKTKLSSEFDLDYFEIREEESLNNISKDSKDQKLRVFIAAKIEGVRLIDNLSLSS